MGLKAALPQLEAAQTEDVSRLLPA
jgi:hypothetical protein